MATRWYCRLMGAEMGPFSASDMVEMVRQRRLTPEDLIRKGPEGDWVPAYLVHGLLDAAARAAPESPPPAARNAAGTKSAAHQDAPGPSSLSGLLSALLLGNRSSSPPAAEAPTNRIAQPAVKSKKDAPARIETPTTASRVDEPEPGPQAPEVPMADRRWFCIVAGERRGPMSFDALKRIAASGKLRPEDRVWSSSCPRWSHANDIPELVFS